MSDNCKKIGKLSALALLSQIPIASAFSKFCEDFVNSNWQERIDLWKEEVIKRLSQLDTEMEERIRNTSNFASILASAQRGALEDMEEDKVSLYANAVINAIKNEDIDNTKKHIFLNMLRDFTKLHIEILKALSKHATSSKNLGTRETFEIWKKYFKKRYPELLNHENIFDMVYAELVNLKLLNSSYVVYELLDNEALEKQTTLLADEFLAFIAEQEKNND